MPALIWISTRQKGLASQQAQPVLRDHAAAALAGLPDILARVFRD
jgi:hypothetical protein